MIVKNGLIRIRAQYASNPRQTSRIAKTTNASFDALNGNDLAASFTELIHNVIAAIDVERFAGDQARSIVGKKSGCDADIINADQASCWSFGLGFVQQGIEFRYA
jgi:hypothetical protein